jgi:hypothetical protein
LAMALACCLAFPGMLLGQTALGSGLNATEGGAISPNSTSNYSDAMWADSTAQRWMMNNRGNGGEPVSYWSCGNTTYGCIQFSGAPIGGSTIYAENTLLYPTGGSGFFLQSGTTGGNNAPVWSAYMLPASLATSGGLLYGSSSSAVSESSAATLGSTGALTISQGTITSSTPVFNQTATWNSSTTTFTNILSNITNTHSASGSTLINLEVGGTSAFKVDTSGNPTAVGQLTLGAASGSAGQVTFNGSSSGSLTLAANSAATTLTSSVGVAAPSVTVNSAGGHIQTNNSSSDIAGVVTISSSTTASITFNTAYNSTPVCVLTSLTSLGTKSYYISAISTTGFTVTISTNGTYSFDYICMGNPN